MRDIVKKFKVYTFEELSDKAKQVAIDWYRDGNLEGYDWWDYVYEDAKDIGKLMGIEIDDIYFSGFWSQGDGACFIGSYGFEKGATKKVKEYAPKDETLHDIVKTLTTLQKENGYKLSATVKHNGRYCHEYCTDIDVYKGDSDWTVDADISEGIIEALRDFMRWIYKRLEEEYEGLNSDENIIEALQNGDYEFYEDGRIYP